MEKERNEKLVEEVAKRNVLKFIIIIAIVTYVIFGVFTAVRIQNFEVFLTFIMFTIPLFVVMYFFVKDIEIKDGIIKHNTILENEEFYQSKDGNVLVEPLANSDFIKDLKNKATFIARQEGDNVIVYITYKEDGIPIEYDRMVAGFLLEKYKFVN